MRKHKHGRVQRVIGGLFVLFVLAVVLGMPACGASLLLQERFGWPGGVGTMVVASFVWFFIFALLVFVPAYFTDKFHRRHGGNAKGHYHYLYDDVVAALKSIGSGNFDVLVTVDENAGYSNMFKDLAAQVNQLAGQLKGMEEMRQDFVANVSHEIQSPITSISGFAALLKQEGLTEEKRLHYLDVIEAECARLSHLGAGLLRLSMLDSGDTVLDKQPYRLDRQLADVLLHLEPLWMEKELEVVLEAGALKVEADKGLMEQVWVNLVHNAIKFTPKGGTIMVKAELEDGWAVCAVRDTGPGIGEKDRLHIFERFYKADSARRAESGGNGLGLSLVKRITELHGGTVEMQAMQEVGSCFIVELPL